MICSQCPRRCGALRTPERGGGVCAMPETPLVARAALHQWEEPPISGTRGAGTVFFAGCALRCVFCQNRAISRTPVGRPMDQEALYALFLDLAAQGAHNIDLVTPSHYAHFLSRVLERPLPVPVVWNSSAYECPETLAALEGKVQIYLPDLKYLTPALAKSCSGAEDYPQYATAAIEEMVRQVGPPVIEDGIMRRGVIIRHLLLPGRLSEAKRVMDWVAERFPRGEVLFSLMSQYLPWGPARSMPGLDRPLRPSEVRAAQSYMAALGLEGFTQDPAAADSAYIPPFEEDL